MPPQKKTLDDLSWLPDQVDPEEEKKKKLKAVLDQLPDQHEVAKPEERSWPEAITSQGLRIVPGVAGAILGGTAGSIVPFAGTTAGTAIGGAAGAAIGETAGEAFDKWMGRRDNINPWEITTQGILGAVPIMGETPGVGAGVKELTKHALRAPIRGAAEGAVLGGIGSIPSSWAETGESPDLSEFLKASAGGAAFGAVTGGVFGSHPAMRRARGLQAIEAGAGKTTTDLNVPPPPPPPNGGATGILPRVPAATPPPADKYAPPTMTLTPAKPGDHVITVNPADTGQVESFRKQGYVPSNVATDGSFQMVRPGGPPPTPTVAAPNAPPTASTGTEIAAVGNSFSYYHEDPIIIPRQQMSAALFQKFKEQGIEFVSVTQDGSSVFRDTGRVPERESNSLAAPNEEMHDASFLGRPKNEPDRTINLDTGEVTPIHPPLDIHAQTRLQDIGSTDRTEASMMSDPNVPGSGFDKNKSFEDQWQEAINHAEILGVRWQDHTNLEDLQLANSKRNTEIIMKTGKDPLNPSAEDPVKKGVEMAQLDYAIRGDKYLEPEIWEPKESDPPEIAEKRRELNDLNFEQEVLLFEEKPGAEGPVLSPEKIDRYNQLHQELTEFDEYGPTRGLASMERPTGEEELPDRTQASIMERPEHGNPRVIDLFRKGLKPTQNTRLARFILPDGTLLEGIHPGAVHARSAEAVGSNLEEALRSGVVRFSGAGIETHGRITYEQADAAIYAMQTEGMTDVFIDGRFPDGTTFWEPIDLNRATPERVMNLVNKQFDLFERGGSEPSFMSRWSGKSDDEFVRMELGDRVQMLRNMQGQYANVGARVANKELLQNAIDATVTGGKVSVHINYDTTGKGPSLTVTDQGPGLPLDMLRNEYTKLTGSGKRGVGAASGRKSIGEMGVGKATYLLGTDAFYVETVTKEPDGSVWKYELEGTPDAMIGEDVHGNPVDPVKINKTRMPNDAQTGTSVTIYDKKVGNLDAAKDYLQAFSEYSATPVEVSLTSNKFKGPNYQHLNLNAHVPVRAVPNGQLVSQGTAPGGDYTITIPDNARWGKASSTVVVINNRGMFQGIETVYGDTGKIPNHVIVNIEPNVPANDAQRYPLTAPTREHMKDEFKAEIVRAINKDIMKKAADNARQDLQGAYDGLQPAPDPKTGQPLPFVVHDSGDRYTPDELAHLNGSRHVQAAASVMKSILDKLNALFPTEQVGGKTSKFGFISGDAGSGGVNLPNPSSSRDNALLVNLMGSIAEHPDNPNRVAQRLVHIIGHEFNHNISRNEGAGFTWSLAEVYTRWDLEDQLSAKQAFLTALTGPDGKYAPEVQDLLREYLESRRRGDTTVDRIKQSGSSYVLEDPGQGGDANDGGYDGERTASFAQSGSNGLIIGPADTPEKPLSVVREAINFTRGATTTGDLSAPMRQGLPLIFRKEWWKSWKQQVTSLGSEKAYQASLAELKKRPIFQSRIDLDPNSRTFGKKTKSFAEQAGIKLSDVSSGLGGREEAVASNWLETGEMLGHGIAQKGYKATIGRYARATNRAYTAFLNQLRADTFEALLKDAERDFKGGTKGAKNPFEDLTFAKEIADYVNTATGKGPLKMARPSVEGGRLHIVESNFERNAQLLTDVLFAPRLFASRMRMLNPATYMMASPFVRKQYLKSALAVAGAWGTVSGLGYMAGQAGIADVDVSMDPNSADFGKMRINNTRLDPAGGFQQYLVALSRLISGRTTSSATQRDTELGVGFHADTRKDIAERFMVNKLTPVMKFGWDLMAASQYQPFHVADRTAQLFVPLIVQDVLELAKEDPSLLPLIAPIATGMGSQTYDKGESVGKLVPTENDWILQGGDPMQRDWAADIPDF